MMAACDIPMSTTPTEKALFEEICQSIEEAGETISPVLIEIRRKIRAGETLTSEDENEVQRLLEKLISRRV